MRRGHLVLLQKLWELAKENLTTEEKKYIILVRDDLESTGWHFAAQKGKLQLFQEK